MKKASKQAPLRKSNKMILVRKTFAIHIHNFFFSSFYKYCETQVKKENLRESLLFIWLQMEVDADSAELFVWWVLMIP